MAMLLSGRTSRTGSKKLVNVKTVQWITNLFNRAGSVSPAVQSHDPARKLSEFEELTVLDCFIASLGIYLDEVQ